MCVCSRTKGCEKTAHETVKMSRPHASRDWRPESNEDSCAEHLGCKNRSDEFCHSYSAVVAASCKPAGAEKKCASKARCPLPSGRCDKAGRRRRRYHAVSWKHEVLQIHLSMKNIEVKVGIVREIVSA